MGQYGLPKAHEGEVMAVLGLAFLLLVVMPFLIYVSVAWVMRAAKLSRRSE
jgi:ABC-type transport system involved in cytochrome bd biosynthesis fused ATPase/permease subunit